MKLERLALKEIREKSEKLVNVDVMDNQDHVDQWDQEDHPDPQEIPEDEERTESPETTVHQETKVPQDVQVSPENQASQEPEEQWDQLDLTVPTEMSDQKVSRVTVDHVVDQDVLDE